MDLRVLAAPQPDSHRLLWSCRRLQGSAAQLGKLIQNWHIQTLLHSVFYNRFFYFESFYLQLLYLASNHQLSRVHGRVYKWYY